MYLRGFHYFMGMKLSQCQFFIGINYSVITCIRYYTDLPLIPI